MPAVGRTGKSGKARRNNFRVILRRLGKMYGPVKPLRRGKPLDVLVEAMLAQNTSMPNATLGYRRLRRAFSSWTKVMNAEVGQVQRAIAVCGLARMRARRLQQLLAKLKADRGALDLGFLAKLDVAGAREYLTSFHGIGPKSAAFTQLFALDHPVVPVDNGILRVVRRLRLVRPKAREREVEDALSALTPVGTHYAAHVLLFRHAKTRCRPKNPKCDECLLLEFCPYGRRRVRHLPPVEKPPRPLRPARFISAGLKKHGDQDLERSIRSGRGR